MMLNFTLTNLFLHFFYLSKVVKKKRKVKVRNRNF